MSILEHSLTSNFEGAKDREMRKIFALFDNGKGFVRTSELSVMMQSLGVGADYLEPSVVSSMCLAMDPRRTGSVDFLSFASVVGPCIADAGSFEEQFRVFRMLDRGRKGYINQDDLEYVSKIENSGMISDAECAFIQTMLRTTSRPGITLDEFKRNISNMLALRGV